MPLAPVAHTRIGLLQIYDGLEINRLLKRLNLQKGA
jgi:hypothetical protein